MDAVAVGGLDQQIIGLCERRRVFEDGLVGAAEIARKEDRAALAVAADIDFDDCGTENMPGGVKRRFDAVADGDDLFELDGTELRRTWPQRPERYKAARRDEAPGGLLFCGVSA